MNALLLLLIAVTPSAANASPDKAPTPKPLPPGMVQVTVGTLHCPGCAKQIARKLYKTPGVMRVKTDMKKNVIWITVQPKKKIDLARVWQATKLKDVQPKSLRIGQRRFIAKDFEKSETAEKSGAATRR